MKIWMLRFGRGLAALREAVASSSPRNVALPWMAVAMLAIVLGSGLAAAWSSPGADARSASEPPDDVSSSGTGLGQALLAMARQAVGAVSSMAGIETAGDTTPAEGLSERLAADRSPEGRLLKAYHALQEGQTQAALGVVSTLVRDHPEFSLAQLLYADLLSARSGRPHVFGLQDQASAHPADRRVALREEALRRWAALQDAPPTGHIPAEFIRLGAEVRHAVAIDASRSRLYLFAHGPSGLTLKRDIYISVGKQGVGKRVEGDQRTPLGVYWITATYKGPMRDPRLGQAALGINYPNAWDRLLGRTGSGLFLHGVPSELLAHIPQATDGCIAMSNDEAISLLTTLDPDTTPVVIAWELKWVPASQVGASHGEFLTAYTAWQKARQSGDDLAVRSWYEARAVPLPGRPEAQAAAPSILAWHGDGAPMMVVSAAHPTLDDGQPAQWRQYWVWRDGKWRIFFDNVVSVRGNRAPLEGVRSAGNNRKSRERSG